MSIGAYVHGGLYTRNRKRALKQAIAVLTKIHYIYWLLIPSFETS